MAFAIWSRLTTTRVRSLCTFVANAVNGESSRRQIGIPCVIVRRSTSTALWWPVLVRHRQTGVFVKLYAGELRVPYERIPRTVILRLLNRSQFRNRLAIPANAHDFAACLHRIQEKR